MSKEATKQESIVAAAIAGANLGKDISYIQLDIAEIKGIIKDIPGKFVTKDQFDPVRNIVYGLIGILGVGTIGALLRMILK